MAKPSMLGTACCSLVSDTQDYLAPLGKSTVAKLPAVAHAWVDPRAPAMNKPSNEHEHLWPGKRPVATFEHWILSAIQMLLMLLVLIGVLSLIYLLGRAVWEQTGTIHDVPMLQTRLQNAFSGVLLTLIGLELIETVRAYLQSHYVRLEVVVIIALIALGRHIVELNPHELDGPRLIGLGVLVFSLGVCYFVVRLTSDRRSKFFRGRGGNEDV
ncbi:hypothetical protein EYV96_16100 [Dyella terrae]|uniref:Diguanylate cyclase n=3 Tax=Rhodanobacteraceae TaxID=1775411 RepID=A0A4R0YNI7_9GAMM|nr:hypothetical protein EYV96_16100 [Dyella terrae]TCI06171.1 hypothetical protein EZM97_35190 [Dyella soli]